MLFVLFHTLQTEKDKDFLTIYDGANEDSNEIRKLSGNLRSFGVSSSGNVMYIKFEADTWDRENGFLATFYYGNSKTTTKLANQETSVLVRVFTWSQKNVNRGIL